MVARPHAPLSPAHDTFGADASAGPLAGLPPAAANLIHDVVRRTGLWSKEREDIRAELAAHFHDGLRAGVEPAELVRQFGDPAQAARLMRRAKKRQRTLLQRLPGLSARALLAGIVALAGTYAVLAARFHAGEPTIRRDYVAEFRARLGAVPESERAWPRHREAVLVLPGIDAALRDAGYPFLKADAPAAARQRLAEFLQSAEPALALARAAARLPHYGRSITTEPDAALVKRAERIATEPAATVSPLPVIPSGDGPRPAVLAVQMPDLQPMRELVHALLASAVFAAEQGEGVRAAADLDAALAMASQVRQGPRFLITELVASALAERAAEAVVRVLTRQPDLLDGAQLRGLAHRLAGVEVDIAGGLEGEQAMFDDILQSAFTDNGRGDGRLTPEGFAFLLSIGAWSTSNGAPPAPPAPGWTGAVGPIGGAWMLSRRAAKEQFDHLLRAGVAYAARPLWLRDELPSPDLEVQRLHGGDGGALAALTATRNAPVTLFAAASGHAAVRGEVVRQRVDAALVLVAAEAYRREQGRYPQRLEDLSPRWLPTIPRDRFDGGPLKYAVRDGRPMLWSVGADRVDDQGVPAAGVDGYAGAPPRWYPRSTLEAMAADSRYASMRGDWVLVGEPPATSTPATPPEAPAQPTTVQP